MAEDPTESRNVAAEHPDRLREMIALWWVEAEKYKVLPLDGRVQPRLADRAPADLQAADALRLLPGRRRSCRRSRRRRCSTARTRSRRTSRSRAAAPRACCVAQGGDAGGYTFYVNDGRLRYIYNYVGRDQFESRRHGACCPRAGTRCATSSSRPARRTSPTARASRGRGQLYVDGELVANAEFPHTTPFMFELEGLSCGYDFGAPASEVYEAPFAFTGTIHR